MASSVSAMPSPLDVDGDGDGFHMVGVEASPVPAEMVDGEPGGDWADKPFVHESVGGVAGMAAALTSGVSVRRMTARPFPTAIGKEHTGQ